MSVVSHVSQPRNPGIAGQFAYTRPDQHESATLDPIALHLEKLLARWCDTSGNALETHQRRITCSHDAALLGAPVVPFLRRMLCGPFADERHFAAMAFGELGIIGLPALLSVLYEFAERSWVVWHDRVESIWDVVAPAMRRIGSKARPTLLRNLAEGSDAGGCARRVSLWGLRLINDPTLSMLSIQCMADPDPAVRALAVEIAGQFRSVNAIPALVQLMADPCRPIARSAAELLGQIAVLKPEKAGGPQ